uniref:Uncharacterized protein n=1 Tax=Peronospora matthiolae TaxID=2874970 RepID=A0AAV1VME8_9STRA
MLFFTLVLLASFSSPYADGVFGAAGSPMIGRQEPAALTLTAEHDGFPSDELPRSGGLFEWPATLIKSVVSCFKPPRKKASNVEAIEAFKESLNGGELTIAVKPSAAMLQLMTRSERDTGIVID